MLTRLSGPGFVLPALLLMTLAIGVPLAMSFWRSISDPALGAGNYLKLFTDGITFTIITRTLITSVSVMLVTVILGYPYAYLMTRVSPTVRTLLFTAVLVPFWTSMTARNFAWLLLLQRDGPLSNFFEWFGVEDVVLLGTTTGVVIAMSQVLLPYMVLPLYSNMSGIDRRLLLAGQALGSTPARAFFRIYFPLTIRGLVSGAILVFALSFGFYVTPAILGSPQQSLIAQLLGQRTLQLLDFAGAGALGIVVLLFTLVLVMFGNRFGGSVSALGATISERSK